MLDVIAQTGIQIADSHGLAAVTMQKIATTLGVTKMALYRHVPGKAELLALMTDAALGEPPPLDSIPGGWRPRLDAWARRLFDRFSRHPWALETTIGARALGPNELGWLEQAAGELTPTGLDGGEILDVAVTLVGHVRMLPAQGAAMISNTPEQDLVAVLRGREDRFPALSAAVDSAAAHGSQGQALDFGLSRILDGVELLIAARA
jgi:AcrR family transcriptional regulator